MKQDLALYMADQPPLADGLKAISICLHADDYDNHHDTTHTASQWHSLGGYNVTTTGSFLGVFQKSVIEALTNVVRPWVATPCA